MKLKNYNIVRLYVYNLTRDGEETHVRCFCTVPHIRTQHVQTFGHGLRNCVLTHITSIFRLTERYRMQCNVYVMVLKKMIPHITLTHVKKV